MDRRPELRQRGRHMMPPPREAEVGVGAALRDLVGAFKPWAIRRIEEEIEDALDRVPTELNEYGYDPFGLHPDFLRTSLLPSVLLHRYYFRADVHDIDRVPEGRVLLVANHAGQLPFDGLVLGSVMLLDADPPRICRPMAEYFVSTLPFVSVAAARAGSLVGTPQNCVRMLEHGEVVMVFPEGVGGLNKTFDKRYQLQRFGTGFMRLALQTGTPIVPVSIVGSEEQQVGLANLKRLGRLVGMPALPITLTFPWLGPLGLLPMPTHYHIYFGEPMLFEGSPDDDDAHIQSKIDAVREVMHGMFDRGLKERKGIFR